MNGPNDPGHVPDTEDGATVALPRRLHDYRLAGRLGVGGMGEVYRALDERLDRWVALKHLRADRTSARDRRRFLREARAAAGLQHPNIVRVHDLLEDPAGDWIVMEWVDGRPLSRWIGQLSLVRTVELAIDITSALAEAHARGIVHRDLKSSNVLIASSGRAKVADFGLVKHVGEHRDGPTILTLDGQIVGTPHAMSPEQAMGRKVDLRSDLFALGALLYQMASGEAPFRGHDALESMHRVCTHQPPPLDQLDPAVPRALSELVGRLLEKSPEVRPTSAAQVVEQLEGIRHAFQDTDDSDEPLASDPAAATATLDPAVSTFDWPVEAPHGTPAPSSSIREKRQVTLLCWELLEHPSHGSDTEAESISRPPRDEILASAIDAFSPVVEAALERYDGYPAANFGHRGQLVFGFPVAREDAALCAVRTARALVRGASFAATTDDRSTFAVRCGIHTGLGVVVASSTGEIEPAAGATLEHASELCASATADEVLLSAETGTLLPPRVMTEPARAATLDERDDERLPTVLRLTDDDPSVDPMVARPETPIIARGAEIDLLIGRWQRCLDGEPQTTLISGEAGLGKSRLVQAFRDQLRGSCQWLQIQGVAYASNSPLHPVLALLRQVFAITDIEADDEACRRIERWGRAHELPVDHLVPLVAPLLSISLVEPFEALTVSPRKQREMTLQVVVDIVCSVANLQPTVLFVEDLHWIDPSTLEWLDQLFERSEQTRLMVVGATRPGQDPIWADLARLGRIELTRLTDDASSALIDQVAAPRQLSPELKRQILSKTDGVPLFIEELVKHLLEHESLRLESAGEEVPDMSAALDTMAIPATLRDSLAARLDRHHEAKSVAQVAAVLGREFSYDLLAAVADESNDTVQLGLDALADAGLIHRVGWATKRRFVFKHALIQDAAYDSLLGVHRRQLHSRVAATLEASFPETRRTEPARLAHHHTEAGAAADAIGYWHLASQATLQASALQEASGYVERGIVLLPDLAGGDARDHLEQQLQMTRGTILAAIKGIADPEVQQTYDEAMKLSKRRGADRDAFWALVGTWRARLGQSQLDAALEDGRELMRVADSTRDAILRVFAARALGSTHLFRGEFRASKDFFDHAIDLDPSDRQEVFEVSRSEEDPVVVALAYRAQTLWYLGFPDQASADAERAIALARRLSHAFSLIYALHASALAHALLGDAERVAEHAAESVRLSIEHGAWFRIPSGFYAAWAEVTTLDAPEPDAPSGLHDPAFEQLIGHIDAFEAIGARLSTPGMLVDLASQALRLGNVHAAAQAVEKAEALLRSGGENMQAAEIARLRGEVVARQATDPGMVDRASRSIDAALEIARQQDSPSLALRAVMSRGRLLCAVDERDRARAMLAEALSEFTEGFETHDLKTAARLSNAWS